LASSAVELSDKQDQLSALSQQMAEDASRLAAAEATIAELQQQQQQQQPAVAAVRSSGEAGVEVDEDLVAELEDRLLEAEQVCCVLSSPRGGGSSMGKSWSSSVCCGSG
jgi:capsule polysaccharide export protein KpsE/RkpR